MMGPNLKPMIAELVAHLGATSSVKQLSYCKVAHEACYLCKNGNL